MIETPSAPSSTEPLGTPSQYPDTPSEQSPQCITDPETLYAIRQNVLDVWRTLPLADQAALVVEQLRGILSTEWGDTVRDLLAEEPERAENSLDEIFPIIGVARADLQRLEFTDEEISQLTDLDMIKIADRLGDHFVDVSFWDGLDYVARRILDGKQQP